jgi:hypothetical protein
MNLSWYTAYKPDTGEIVTTFTSDESSVASNTPAGATIIDGEFWASAGYIQADAFVAYTEEQAQAKRNRPGAKFRWSNQSMSWEDLRDLSQVKSEKWEQIKAKRDEVEHGGFTWDGSRFDSDLASQNKIIGAVQLANVIGDSFTIDWTLSDNSVRTLNRQQMVGVGEALGVHVVTQHTIGRSLRQQIENATTAADVAAVTWPETQ